MEAYANTYEYMSDIVNLTNLKNESLKENFGAKSCECVMACYRRLKERVSVTKNFFIPLEYIIYLFGLNALEEHILYTLAADTSTAYELDFLCELMGYERSDIPVRYMYSIQSLNLNLIETMDNGKMVLKRRVINYIYNPGQSISVPWVNMYYPVYDPNISNFCFDDAVISPIMKLTQNCLKQEFKNSNIILLHGRKGIGRKSVIKYLSSNIKVSILFIDTKQIADEINLTDILHDLVLESLLMDAFLCFDDIGCINKLTLLLNVIKPVSKLVFFVNQEPINDFYHDTYILTNFAIPIPSYEVRENLFKSIATKYNLQIEASIPATLYRLTPYQIDKALREAATNVTDTNNATEALLEACRSVSTSDLGDFGKLIEPVFSWDDLVLPDKQKEMLSSAVNRMMYRDKVYREWDFKRKMPYGTGLHILLAGQSGTGKTMAAQVLAGELRLPIYKIDSSTILSKYIGETEKNLGKIFAAAADSNCILFFDEADSLFAKRTDVKDSHDRHANSQVAFLLQKVEEYQGITILATNLLKNFDDAYKRRFHYIIEFPFPDHIQRRGIWEKVFPAAAPLIDIDFDYLSHNFKLTGGNIKNIALTAAFSAAAENRAINMQDIIIAIKIETDKSGILVLSDNLEGYFFTS